MNGERYVVMGLARPRQSWLREVAKWTTTASLPAEFIMCLSAEEVHARLDGGRLFSALLVDGGISGLDRDLIAAAQERDCVTIVVQSPGSQRDWEAVGAATTIAADFDRNALLAALGDVAAPVAEVEASGVVTTTAPHRPSGRLVAVTGPAGHGASTIAMATAQGLAETGRAVLLADLCLDADLAMLHDAGDIVPGVQELVDAFRLGEPTTDELSQLVFSIPARGYRLLLGLRRHRDWASIRPRAFDRSLEALRSHHEVVVADVEPDVEGQELAGSVDIEDRNLFARSVLQSADVVVLVADSTPRGVYGLLRVVDRLRTFGVEAERMQPLFNRAPRRPRHRAELSSAVAQLSTAPLANPIFVGDRRRLATDSWSGTALPGSVAAPLASAIAPLLHGPGARQPDRRHRDPSPVRPGSLGHWPDGLATP